MQTQKRNPFSAVSTAERATGSTATRPQAAPGVATACISRVGVHFRRPLRPRPPHKRRLAQQRALIKILPTATTKFKTVCSLPVECLFSPPQSFPAAALHHVLQLLLVRCLQKRQRQASANAAGHCLRQLRCDGKRARAAAAPYFARWAAACRVTRW